MNIITLEEVTTLLTQDSYYRKLKQWPLLTSNSFINPNKTPEFKDLFSIKAIGDFRYGKPPLSLELIKYYLEYSFPFIKEILEKYRTNLTICGGSLTSAYKLCSNDLNYRINSDVDFFFYNIGPEQATLLRSEIIIYICELWKSLIGKTSTELNRKFYRNRGGINVDEILLDVDIVIERNEYVTTINIIEHYSNDNTIKFIYQLIHRLYPNISSIIGGFDISACMMAYDGIDLYTTPLGAWSIKNNSIIVDTKRRSTSYEHRLRKYNKRGFNILFPGLLQTTIKQYLTENILNCYEYKRAKFIDDTLTSANKLGLYIKYPGNLFKDKNKSEQRMFFDDEYPYHLAKCYDVQKENDILPYLCIAPNDINDYKVNEFSYYIGTLLHGKYKRSIIDQNLINKISDYNYYNKNIEQDNIGKMNFTKLRNNKLTSVVSICKINVNDDNKLGIIDKDLTFPNLGINNDIISNYKSKALSIILESKIWKLEEIYCWNYRDLMKYFGEYTNDVIINHKNYNVISGYLNLLENRGINNGAKCKEMLTGIKWITENPERQWTSSINPIFEDPRKWYGKHYCPVTTGIPQNVETLMRLIYYNDKVWNTLPREIFDYILEKICKGYADEAWKYFQLI